MAAAPPPPPNPNDFNSSPFNKSSCSTSRPALRRSKTLANPEGATTWRREPLLDVTNFVLGGGSFVREGRLQRVPTPTILAPSAAPSTLLSSSPTPTPTRPQRRLRRTQSDIPSSSSPSSANSAFPSTPTTDRHSNDPPASPSPLGGLGTRTRRRTTITGGAEGGAAAGGAGTARPTRARTITADSAMPTPAVAVGGTRRTRSSLPVVLEEGSRGGEDDEAGDAQRRLRRRRTSTGGFR